MSLGLSVTLVSRAKTAEPIVTPFGLRTRVGPGNYLLDGVQTHKWEGAILRGKGVSHCKLQGHSAVICAKTTEPVEMPFWLWDRMGPRHRVFDAYRDPPMGRGIMGKGAPSVKYRDRRWRNAMFPPMAFQDAISVLSGD